MESVGLVCVFFFFSFLHVFFSYSRLLLHQPGSLFASVRRRYSFLFISSLFFFSLVSDRRSVICVRHRQCINRHFLSRSIFFRPLDACVRVLATTWYYKSRRKRTREKYRRREILFFCYITTNISNRSSTDFVFLEKFLHFIIRSIINGLFSKFIIDHGNFESNGLFQASTPRTGDTARGIESELKKNGAYILAGLGVGGGLLLLANRNIPAIGIPILSSAADRVACKYDV